MTKLEIKSPSLKSAFRLASDEISSSNRKGSVLTMGTPRETSTVTPTEDRMTRMTENEEIYIKVFVVSFSIKSNNCRLKSSSRTVIEVEMRSGRDKTRECRNLEEKMLIVW